MAGNVVSDVRPGGHYQEVGTGLLVAGDLNQTPDADAPRAFSSIGLTDVIHRFAEGPSFRGTSRRLDYIFADTAFAPDATATRLDVDASDHIPIYADLVLQRR